MLFKAASMVNCDKCPFKELSTQRAHLVVLNDGIFFGIQFFLCETFYMKNEKDIL